MIENPQYMAVHKTDNPGALCWDINNPSTFNQKSVDEILDAIGTLGTDERTLAVAYTYSYARYPIEKVAESIRRTLALSEENDLPVILHLDGVNWWTAYPSLWNFWDENAAGYDPDNIYNVERFGWEMDTAVKLGWRNWGSQIRVPPPPNLASPAFLQLQRDCLDEILPIIADWYDALPEEKQYLLGGIVFGWELSPYVQAYYYEGGNDLLDKPASGDPQGGVGQSIALGYAAAQTLGLQTEGVLTQETVDAICAEYMNFLIEIAEENGIARANIIAHSFVGGQTKRGGGHSGSASVQEGVLPGWSFYGSSITELDSAIDLADGGDWAAIEFKPWDLSSALFKRVFSYRGCRYINIFNWESIRDNNAYTAAIRRILES